MVRCRGADRALLRPPGKALASPTVSVPPPQPQGRDWISQFYISSLEQGGPSWQIPPPSRSTHFCGPCSSQGLPLLSTHHSQTSGSLPAWGRQAHQFSLFRCPYHPSLANVHLPIVPRREADTLKLNLERKGMMFGSSWFQNTPYTVCDPSEETCTQINILLFQVTVFQKMLPRMRPNAASWGHSSK